MVCSPSLAALATIRSGTCSGSLQQALSEVRAGRTTFVIAHRLWTVQQADQILVLRHGRIIERARSTPERSAHQTLVAAGGFYCQLVALQFQAETLAAGEPAEGGAR
jgi:ABC-type multidrug transport system fused ATPase/permease subunit